MEFEYIFLTVVTCFYIILVITVGCVGLSKTTDDDSDEEKIS